jgi:5S rRNA maturation endonuclease (ribonuclease M5)
VVSVQETERAEKRRRLIAILDELREGVAVVEGKHDIKALRDLGISAFSYETVMRGRSGILPGARLYILTDIDRRGVEKAEAAYAELSVANASCSINRSKGVALLRMCNATSVEQIYRPVREIMEES